MPRIPLPPSLNSAGFHVHDARALGILPGRLRGADLNRPFRGVRSSDAALTALAYLPLLRPGDRFSYTTAAALWPLALPRVQPELHVSATRPRNAPRSRGVVGHLSGAEHAVTRHGLPLSDAATLFVELATLLSENELVAIGDALVLDPAVLDPSDPRPWVTLADLSEACGSSRAHGNRLARRAVARVRQGAESREESLLRLLILSAGLPEPELNQELFDATGRWIGRFDMVYRLHRVIVEYDGDQHRTSTRQYEKDMSRIDRAIANRWTVVRVRARGLYRRPAETIERVRTALSE